MKTIFILLLLLGALKPEITFTQNFKNKDMEKDPIKSTILKETISLNVHLPEGYETTSKTYPVLYLLDGTEERVAEIADTIQHLQQEKHLPELIVVGIENTIGDRDLIPERVKDYQKEMATNFLTFMEQELMPTIEKKYRTQPQRILYDKSLRGSFPLYALLTKPALFTGYIATSGRWFVENHDYLTGLANKAFQNKQPYQGKKIFMATLIGAYDIGSPDTDENREQMLEFSEMLTTKLGEHVSFQYQTYDDWGVVRLPGFSDGLLFVFESE